MAYTLLETVNYVISQVGASPVADLNSLLPDVTSSLLRIDEALVNTLARGWWFNTDINVEITKDVDDKYPIPTGTMKIVRASPYFLLDRGGFAYDAYTQTTVFPDGPATICADLVMKLDYADIPYSVQDVIRFVAAREMVMIELEDIRKAEALDIFIQNAMAEVKKDDLEVKRRNMWYGPKFLQTRGGVRPYNRGSRSINPYRPGG